MLAGTPNLRQHLNAMGASFWNRAAPIRVGRIGEEAAAEGFRRPFEEEGFSVAREALAAMVRESQCYPYFVQLLGSAVWRKAVEAGGRHRVTAKEVAAARAEFDLGKNDYYLHRLEELERLRLLTVAGSVADAFRGRTILTAPRFREAVVAGMGEGADLREVDGATDALRDLGYVWRVPGRMDWEPGIPSLMDYTRDQLR